jgi:hypothetical protein
MRAGSYDFFDAIHVQYLDVGHRQHLKSKLIASSPCRIAGTALLRPQDCKFDPALFNILTKATVTFL